MQFGRYIQITNNIKNYDISPSFKVKTKWFTSRHISCSTGSFTCPQWLQNILSSFQACRYMYLRYNSMPPPQALQTSSLETKEIRRIWEGKHGKLGNKHEAQPGSLGNECKAQAGVDGNKKNLPFLLFPSFPTPRSFKLLVFPCFLLYQRATGNEAGILALISVQTSKRP